MTSLQSRSGVLRSSTVQIGVQSSTTSTYSSDYKGLDFSFCQIPPSSNGKNLKPIIVLGAGHAQFKMASLIYWPFIKTI